MERSLAKQVTAFDLAALAIDPTTATSRYTQLYTALRDSILAGRMAPGSRLPSTRDLCRTLGIHTQYGDRGV